MYQKGRSQRTSICRHLAWQARKLKKLIAEKCPRWVEPGEPARQCALPPSVQYIHFEIPAPEIFQPIYMGIFYINTNCHAQGNR